MLTRWLLTAVSGLALTVAVGGFEGGQAQAAPYGAAGCGLGSLVFHDEPGFIQVVAATLNGTGVQTFGITSGTSNCAAKSKKSADQQQLSDFIVANLATLKVESARGQGDSLTGLAALLGCDGEPATLQAFGSMTQAKYEALLAQPDAAGMATVFIAGVREHTELRNRCGLTS